MNSLQATGSPFLSKGDPAIVPVPQWCRKDQAYMPAAEDPTGKLQNSIAELLKFYSDSSATGAVGTFGNSGAQQKNVVYATPARPKCDSPESEPSPSNSVDGKDHSEVVGNQNYEQSGSSGSEPEREQVAESQQADEMTAGANGLCGCTTVMIRYIPSKYTQNKLMGEINYDGFDGLYDFFYLPIDTRNHGNRGFGFINFLSAISAEMFYNKYHGQYFKHFEATSPIAVMPADVQGFEQSAERFFAAGKLHKKKNHGEPIFMKPLPPHLREDGRHGKPGEHGRGKNRQSDSRRAAQKSEQKSPVCYSDKSPTPAPIVQHMPLHMPQNVPQIMGGPLGLPCPTMPTMPPRFCQRCGNGRVPGHAFCMFCGDRLYY